MREQAHSVAQDFLADHMPKYRQIHLTVLRLAILDCLFCGDEQDFIAKVTGNTLLGADARRVIELAAPFLVDLAGETYKRGRHGTTA